MSNDPNSLDKPPVGARTISPKIIFVGMLFFGIALVFIIYSIFKEPEKKEQAREQREVAIDQVITPTLSGERELGLNIPSQALPAPPKDKGVAKEAKPAPENKPEIQLEMLVAPQKSALEQRREQELLQIRQWQMERELRALEAPLRPSNLARIENQTPAQQDTRLQGLQNELAQAKQGMYGQQGQGQVAMSGNGFGPGTDQIAGPGEGAFLGPGSTLQTGTPGLWQSPYQRTAGHPFEVKTGGIIPAVLLTGINSDLPGQITAQVSQNIYDTATGYNLLIPQGTRLLGQYQSGIIMGQERLLVAWNRLIFPDGSSMTLDAFPGTDQAGYSGLSDKTDNHYFRIYANAILMALITGGTAYAVDKANEDSNSGEDDNITVQSELSTALATQLGQTSMELLRRNMSVSPTLEIRPGYRFNVVIVKDLVFANGYEGWR